MSTTIPHRVELPAGYSVVDRLGAGGYGEVWKATAPGGVEKAVKIVFGHCDEGMAERELKSLERIKSVRHPFLLTIERYEVVNNRLVIVTELADMSLSDCFQTHLSEGRSGIPREQLIAYMWDAAEALDCLVERHSLQHLDIKPENLLVVGDHIKVADFGLVKELAAKTLNSMMGGMTPLYSAPEIYDNNPTSRSDQYSLAIVYQHMLTGSLPFSGRTPAQLAKQHTLAEPNLNPLSEAERPIVRKALEKDPKFRFSNCREFISALRSVGQTNSVSTQIPGDNNGAHHYRQFENDDTKSVASVDTKHLKDPICAAATQVLPEIKNSFDLSNPTPEKRPDSKSSRAFPSVDSTIEEVEIPDFNQTLPTAPVPTLFVGIGGMGIKMIRAIRNRASADGRAALAWLAIDTERETLKDSSDGVYEDSLSTDEKLHIPLRRPNQYREDSQALLQWVSRRWLYNIPRSLQTRGFRPLGRIAIVDHAAAVLTALQKQLHWLATNNHTGDELQRPIRVVLLVGMSGGTGGGTIIDIAQGIRSICQEFSQAVEIHGVLGCTFHPESNDSLAAANMYSLLTELNHAQLIGNCGESPPPGPASRFELSQRPFDEIYTIAIPARSCRTNCDLTLQSIADYLLLEASGHVCPSLDAIRLMTEQSAEQTTLHTFSCVNIGQMAKAFTGLHRQHLVSAIAEHWLTHRSESTDSDARFFDHYANSRLAHAILAHFPIILVDTSDPTCGSETSNARTIRTAKIKCIAKAFLNAVESLDLQYSNNESPLDSPVVESACERIVAEVSMILHGSDVHENELAQKIVEIIDTKVNELTALSSVASPAKLVASSLSIFEAGPLNCGYRRRTMLVSPVDQTDSELTKVFSKACPTLVNYNAAISETYLIREGSELHPLHFGSRLANAYPDIDEAAGRLHARDDIKWHDLRGN